MGTNHVENSLFSWFEMPSLTMTFKVVDPKEIEKVVFNNPATIIYWKDGIKTVVKCQPGDTYDKEKGFMAAVMKKLYGNDNTFNKEIRKWCDDIE